jgi:hypothetical protein
VSCRVRRGDDVDRDSGRAPEIIVPQEVEHALKVEGPRGPEHALKMQHEYLEKAIWDAPLGSLGRWLEEY